MRPDAVAKLRAVHEAWARALLGLEEKGDLVAQVRAAVEQGVEEPCAQAAAQQLAAAEQWQWEMGTWATGSGEGLASMFEVRSLQLAQAWLVSVMAPHDALAAAELRRLAMAVSGDPNDVAARQQKHLNALLERASSGG